MTPWFGVKFLMDLITHIHPLKKKNKLVKTEDVLQFEIKDIYEVFNFVFFLIPINICPQINK